MFAIIKFDIQVGVVVIIILLVTIFLAMGLNFVLPTLANTGKLLEATFNSAVVGSS